MLATVSPKRGTAVSPQAKLDTAAALAIFGCDALEGQPVYTREFSPWLRNIAHYASMTEVELGRVDIGAKNIEAALGLPGTSNLDVQACVLKLNNWARQVRHYTEAHWHLYRSSPSKYDNSPAQFRMLALVTYLQKHLGVHYNLSFSEGDYNALDSRNLFLHGILAGHGGTCVTMPVLYLAIGRRLGYPLKLVRAKEHLFARWEEPGERFNIECTSPGFRSVDDEYYHHWPKPIDQSELRSGYFLRSLQPRVELAEFLCERARCLMDNLRLAEALQACFLAGQLAIKDQGVRGTWSIVTVMARALERARAKAGLERYEGLDLSWVYVPDGKTPVERWAAPIARDNLKRIARIRKSMRVKRPDRTPCEFRPPGGTIIVGAGF